MIIHPLKNHLGYGKIKKIQKGGIGISYSVSAKAALAKTMRQLLEVTSFSKISVSSLCDACGINRKSFYYHFKDKYDLVCWIFESEVGHMMITNSYASDWDMLLDMCEYLDENRSFYAKILRIDGQNSFREFFGKTVAECVRFYYHERIDSPDDLEFLSHFLAGALLLSIMEWITDADPVSPRDFTEQLRRCVKNLHLSN